MTHLTAPDTSAIRQRLEKITPGPWRAAETWRPPIKGVKHTDDRHDANGNVFWGYSISGADGALLPTLAAVHNFPNHVDANADFIAHAPADIAALLAEVERLRALVAAPKDQERKPGEGWQISEQTQRETEAIERNQREARANMPNILVGAKEGDTP